VSPTLRYKSTADYVTAEIRRLILNGDLSAGARIDQVDIATRLEVSRHPVRQALERLAERGFVQINPHHSAIVSPLSIPDMEELYHARNMLEGWALRSGWPSISARRDEIARHYETLERADPVAGIEDYMQANREFHLAMYRDCGNRHLLRTIVAFFDLSERYQRTALQDAARLEASGRDHGQMMLALDAHDLDRLAALIEHHNMGTRETVAARIG